MSGGSLRELLTAACAPQVVATGDPITNIEVEGMHMENARLQPILERLIDVAEAAELNASAQHGHGYAIHLVTTLEAVDDALARLREVCVE